ncbi:hypothetical protein C1I89_22115 [Achromobacter pulmonis]|uniref:Uncharacterized protein n=2 Tax=Achromobacter pulmonis TaxID=1389932 RepID=A0A2N8KDK3_9BURK|nr:hypothetical protein C1I89_22115 [Achromobacter pulmonis]
MRGDYSQFIWQKLDSIDTRLGELAERHGRMDEKQGRVASSLEKVEGKVSDVEKSIRWVKALFVVGGALIGGAFALYKVFESHISITLK